MRVVEKPWGRDVLPAPFESGQGQRIGEIWFEPPEEMTDILVKYIFTSEKLSVQVHPSDDQARELGETGQGKEECWLVLDAEPGATLGIGFDEPLDADSLGAAALDGRIESLMTWHAVARGDFFYIPAGTVHAIGAGITLVEIQQNSDITYRLYDYGRPRELHLDKGVAVADAAHRPVLARRCDPSVFRGDLVRGAFFCAEVIDERTLMPDDPLREDCLLIVLESERQYEGEGPSPGTCMFVAAGEVANLADRFTAIRVTRAPAAS